MNRPEEEFFKGTLAKVVRMIELYHGVPDEQEPVKYVNSMRDFLK